MPPPPSVSLLEHHSNVLIARNETVMKEKERRKSAHALKLDEVELIRIEVGEHAMQKDFAWVSEVSPVIQLS